MQSIKTSTTQARKHISSYTLRVRGSKRKQLYIDKFSSVIGRSVIIEPSEKPIDWSKVFASIKNANLIREDISDVGKVEIPKMILEIGFGKGESIIHNALRRPNDLFIGIEVYSSGVASVLREIEKHDIKNIALIQYDAISAIRNMFEEEILDEIHLLFPDPWPKKRHHKRRMLSKEVIELMLSKLKSGGLLNIATDWQDYAEEILKLVRCLESENKLSNMFKDYAPGPQLARAITGFESKAKSDGKKVYEFLLKKV